MASFSGGKEQRDILEEGPRGRPTMVIRDDKSQAQQQVLPPWCPSGAFSVTSTPRPRQWRGGARLRITKAWEPPALPVVFIFQSQRLDSGAALLHTIMKRPPAFAGGLTLESGSYLLSRAVASQVPSACKSLTSVFGMGTGGSS